MAGLRFTLRMFLKTPVVTAVAITSLALGIGTNTAIFSLAYQTLLRALPVQAPDQLVNLGAPGPKNGWTSCNNAGDCDHIFSFPMFRDLESQQTVFTGIAAHRSLGVNLGFHGQTLSGTGMLVSGGYFSVLGVPPVLGRVLIEDDAARPGQRPVVVLAYDYWTRRFGADPDVLNDTLVVNGRPLTIVGVAARGFTGTTLGNRADVFAPVTMRHELDPTFDEFDNRRAYWVYLFARLRPGVTIEQARAAINQPYRAIITGIEAADQSSMSPDWLARFREKVLTLDPGARGQSQIHEEARTPLVLLFCVTGVVLLIACANVANLLLARSSARAGEIAVRLSIGASRAQIIRQLLTEACLLALCGGLFGLFVASWTLAWMKTLLPPDAGQFPQFSLNLPVLLFAAGVAVGTGLLFGVFPALHSTRLDLASMLKGWAGHPSGARAAAFFRNALVTAQIALSMALLASAGLFTKSLVNVTRVDLGLDTDGLVTFSIAPRRNGYTPGQTLQVFLRVEDELAAIPGATGVSAALVPVLAGDNWSSNVTVEGFEAGPDADTNSSINAVGPGYFRLMGVPLISGREFTDADTLGAPKVVIVNEAFVRKFNLGAHAVGTRMRRGGAGEFNMEIVGVVRDAKYSDVKRVVPPLFVTPYRQDDELGDAVFYVRSAVDPDEILRAVPPVIARLDPNLPVEALKTMSEQVRQNMFLDRFVSMLSAAFAVLATVLAAIGLYGVLAYTVSQRTREIGLRMALGADPARVRRLVLSQVAWMTIVGGVAGLALAVTIGTLAGSLLYQMVGYDPLVLVVSASALTGVALAAGLLPAQRASRVDPMVALRWE